MLPSVLVVGQDDARLRATREALASGGLTNPVVACADAAEAATYLRGHAPYSDREAFPPPAIVITDLHLDGGSGIDVLRLMRSHLTLRRVPAVVIADQASEEEIAEVHHVGAAAFLSEAVASHVLLGVIRDCGAPWALGRIAAPA